VPKSFDKSLQHPFDLVQGHSLIVLENDSEKTSDIAIDILVGEWPDRCEHLGHEDSESPLLPSSGHSETIYDILNIVQHSIPASVTNALQPLDDAFLTS
jgi:hypothetical protein